VPPNHARKATELDARSISIAFSPSVREAFGDLDAAVRNSEHFDPAIRQILHGWAEGKPQSIHDVLIAFPLIAEQATEHIRATNDERAREAWREVCSQMPEKGFRLSKARGTEADLH
jgi:hypothetical protein